MSKKAIIFLVTSLLSGCHASTPNDLAQVVLMEEVGQLDGVHMGFVPCVSVDSRDVDARTLESLRKVYSNLVPGSECQWDIGGSIHKPSGHKAMLVNVFGYKRSGEIEFEARHHGRFGTMKTLQVRRESSGWRIVATLKFMMAYAEQSHAGDARDARARWLALCDIGEDTMKPKHCAVAIVPCSDLNASQAFYERLGFAATSIYDAHGYRILHDPLGASVHLTRVDPEWVDPKRNPHGIYFYSENVEDLASGFGCRAQTKPWGLREFAVSDPDGTLVRVGWPA